MKKIILLKAGMVGMGWILVLILVRTAGAHFQTFWPDVGNGYGQRGKVVTWTYFWGHPYEKILFDTQKPNFYVIRPDGKRDSVLIEATEMIDEETGKRRKTYKLTYTPTAIGDSYLCLEAPPYFVEEEGLFWKDYVKQYIHVMAEQGWDRPVGMEIEIVPLTRPYGMEEGFVFKGQALFQGKPLVGAIVEIEKFNGFHVKEGNLPMDPYGKENVPMITRVCKTDVNGYLVCTLDEPGWWMISVAHSDGELEYQGKKYTVEKRGGLWLYIEKRFVQR
jgi:cobalt/nickel transport protein